LNNALTFSSDNLLYEWHGHSLHPERVRFYDAPLKL
jgi:hypothetical protein